MFSVYKFCLAVFRFHIFSFNLFYITGKTISRGGLCIWSIGPVSNCASQTIYATVSQNYSSVEDKCLYIYKPKNFHCHQCSFTSEKYGSFKRKTIKDDFEVITEHLKFFIDILSQFAPVQNQPLRLNFIKSRRCIQ